MLCGRPCNGRRPREPDNAVRLLVRADATPDVGAGHVMRCAGLAEAWLGAGIGEATVIGDVTLPFVGQRLRTLGVGIAGHATQTTGDVLVVDSYDEGIRHEGTTGVASLRVLVDDLGTSGAGYDVIWNPNAYQSEQLYPGFRGEVISQHVPLRSGMPTWSGESSAVAVSLGGTTPTSALIEAIDAAAKSMQLTLVASRAGWVPTHWELVPADSMWTEFAKFGRLLTAGGSTVWEAAHVGIPVAVLVTAANQQLVGEWVRAHGAPSLSVAAGTNGETLARELSRCISAAATLPRIENGAPAVAQLLRNWALRRSVPAGALMLRAADFDDAQRLWLWANDAETRRSASDRPPISWTDHVDWLTGQLASSEATIWIGVDEHGAAVGSIRFDTEDSWKTARLSYVVDPASRGRQLGRRLVDQGTSRVVSDHPGVDIWADVLKVNVPSLRVFRGLGWRETEGEGDMTRFHPPLHGPA